MGLIVCDSVLRYRALSRVTACRRVNYRILPCFLEGYRMLSGVVVGYRVLSSAAVCYPVASYVIVSYRLLLCDDLCHRSCRALSCVLTQPRYSSRDLSSCSQL